MTENVVLHLSCDPNAIVSTLLLTHNIENARHIIVSFAECNSIDQYPQREVQALCRDIERAARDCPFRIPIREAEIEMMPFRGVVIVVSDISSDLLLVRNTQETDERIRQTLRHIITPNTKLYTVFPAVFNNLERFSTMN